MKNIQLFINNLFKYFLITQNMLQKDSFFNESCLSNINFWFFCNFFLKIICNEIYNCVTFRTNLLYFYKFFL